MKVIPCGTLVKVNLSNIEGSITEISIRFEMVMYRVLFPCEGKMGSDWFFESEFTVTGQTKKQTIGFHKNNS